jgi:hypothetical protein
VEVKAVLDKKGSECRQLRRYTFGKVGDAVSGGVYVDRATPLPSPLVITFPDVVPEEEAKSENPT